MPPTWDHDCKDCKYLGTSTVPRWRVGGAVWFLCDFYVCFIGSPKNATVISRDGNEPHEYSSGNVEYLSLMSDMGLQMAGALYLNSLGVCATGGEGWRYTLQDGRVIKAPYTPNTHE